MRGFAQSRTNRIREVTKVNSQQVWQPVPRQDVEKLLSSPILPRIMREIINSLVMAATDSILDRVGLSEEDAAIKRALVREAVSFALGAVLSSIM